MRSRIWTILQPIVLCGCLGGAAFSQSPHILNTFDTLGNEYWLVNFNNTAIQGNDGGQNQTGLTASGGSLRWVSLGTAASGGAVSDSFNNGDFGSQGSIFQQDAGGVDLTGLDAIEFDIGYTGADPTINVQLFVQADTSSTYVGATDITLSANMIQTVTFPLSLLTPPQAVFIRTWGINIRDHASDANFELQEVRSVGTPLTERVYASFAAGSPNGGFNSAIVNFDGTGVQGNTAQDNSGLSVNAGAGVDGALEWTDLGGGPGGAISIFNGYNTGFNGRPTDISNYPYLIWRMSATGADSSIGAQFFIQTSGSFTYRVLSETTLNVNAGFQTFLLDLSAVPETDHVQTIGVNLHSHANDAVIQVDEIKGGPIPVVTPSSSVENWNLY
ncbi:MAG: hypothetical protein HUU16_17860 [Candidatus Omnitrophica bacterium]|nr:hypothetical protein [Candidatus Omnitrophota bacterium]